MSNNRNYKGKKNTGLKVVSVLLAVLTAAAGVACGIGWMKAVKLEKQVNELIRERDDNADKIPMTFKTYGIVAEDYEKYGIPESAINSKLIVADFTPENTTDKRCNWTVKWKDGTTDGIDEYISFSPAAKNGASCAVGCLQPFNQTIVVTCTSVANSRISATTNLEYVERYSDIFDCGGLYMEHFTDAIDVFSDLYTADGDYGSVLPDSFEADVTIEICDGLYNYLRQEDCDVSEYVEYKNITARIPSTTDSTFNGYSSGWVSEFNALYPEDVSKWCLDNDTDCIGTITATVRCYYKGEFMYDFTGAQDWYLSAGCLAEMAVPPQGVNTPPEIAL